MKNALSFSDVTKRYSRNARPALDNLSCQFPTGAISGLLGPNGAGKTTAFSLVGGFLSADSGEMRILGDTGFDPWRLKGHLGLLPQDAELPDRHTPSELLDHLARLQGMSGADAGNEARRLCELVNLDDRAHDRIASLSHGMRRRVAVASALIGTPKLVLLDEPTAGLDPVQAASLRAALGRMRGKLTMVVSSHNIDEIEKLADHVVMMDRGKCVRQGSMGDVTGSSQLVHWQLGEGNVPLEELNVALPGHTLTVKGRVLTVEAGEDADLDATSVIIMAKLAAAGVALRGVKRGESLEQSFLNQTR